MTDLVSVLLGCDLFANDRVNYYSINLAKNGVIKKFLKFLIKPFLSVLYT